MLNSYYRKKILNYLNYFSHPEISVLEVGCIDGYLISAIQGNKRTGICFTENELKQCKKNYPNIHFILQEPDKIQIREQYDLIILQHSIARVRDVQTMLDLLKNVCHSQTKVIIGHYNHFWEPILRFGEFIGIKKKTPLANTLNASDIKNILFLSNFDVYKQTKQLIIPINIPVISYITNRFLSHLPIIHQLQLNNYSFAKFNDAKSKEYTTTVVIPARNESGNIENAILRLPKFGKHIEIIFIEGNSNDDTWQKIQEVQKKYALTHDIKIGQQRGKGKADAVREGFKMATGDILMILDADLTVPPEDLPKFYNAIAEGKGDFINGTRLVYPMEKEAMRFLNLVGNQIFSWAFSWLLEQPFKDTLCGTKVLFRKDYQRLVENREYFGNFDPFGDFDLIFGAHKLNLKIVEIPIRYRERTYGTTNISRFKHGLILLKMCVFAARKIKFV